MTNTVFYLSTCTTCKRIMEAVGLPDDFPRQDIKTTPLTANQVDQLKTLAGSYEALFNRRAQLYRKRNLKEQALAEDDYRKLLLEHYTFLKRPVFVIDNKLYIGNAKKTEAAVKEQF